MTGLVDTWWNALSGFVLAALGVFGGDLTALPLMALIGIACLIAGIVLLFAWRVKRALRALLLVAAAILAPVAMSLANAIVGPLGVLFAVLAGALFLVVGTAVFANSADRRLPIWLIGAFSILLAAYCAIAGGAFQDLA